MAQRPATMPAASRAAALAPEKASAAAAAAAGAQGKAQLGQWARKMQQPPAPTAGGGAVRGGGGGSSGPEGLRTAPPPQVEGNSNFGSGGSRQGGYDASFLLNNSTKEFISKFYYAFNMGYVPELRNLYIQGWTEQTRAYYKGVPWPSAESVSALCDDSAFFLLLYKEMCFRHVYNIQAAGVLEMVDSYRHFLEMFDFILQYGTDMPYQLPLEWLYDIINEFVYQFQAFWQFHGNLSNKTDADVSALRANAGAWAPTTVLSYLQQLQRASLIREAIDAEQEQVPMQQQLPGQVLHMVGYFAFIGECRVHQMLGDYKASLRVIDFIDLAGDPGLFSRVRMCHVMLYYCAGFAYMMLQRLPDAARVFNNMTDYLQRTQAQNKGSFSGKAVSKKSEQMVALLCLIRAVAPGVQLDDKVLKKVQAHSKNDRVRSGDSAVFGELFRFGSPAFILPTAPDYTQMIDHNVAAYEQQARPFLEEIRHRYGMGNLSGDINLYNSVTVEKLSTLLDGMDLEAVRRRLMFIKHKTMYKVWKGGPPQAGDWQSFNKTHYFVVNDTVHVTQDTNAKNKVSTAPLRYFMDNSIRLEDVVTNVNQDWSVGAASKGGTTWKRFSRNRGRGRGRGRGGRGGRGRGGGGRGGGGGRQNGGP